MTTAYLFDLSTTEEETLLAEVAAAEHSLGIIRKANGSLNMRSTVYNFLKTLSGNSLRDGVTIDAIESALFHYEIEVERAQISMALASLARCWRVNYDRSEHKWYMGSVEMRNW